LDSTTLILWPHAALLGGILLECLFARLLSNQVLAGTIEEQKQLLAQSEIKLLQAQINPHFLFNALNTLEAVIRSDPQAARQIVHDLSTFFRKSLKRPNNEATLKDEIEHVNAYLRIELARFAGRLDVSIAVADDLLPLRLPTSRRSRACCATIGSTTMTYSLPPEAAIGPRR